MSIILNFFILISSFAVLILGANLFVDGSSSIATKFKIPQVVVGLTIVAIGTSAPEFAIGITSAIKGSVDITMGNVLGSNIINILIILGVNSLFIAIPMAKSTKFIDLPILIGLSTILIFFGLDGDINLLEGIIFLLLFVLDIIYLTIYAKRNKTQQDDKIKIMPLYKSIILFLLGLAMIILGSNYVVDSATQIAAYFGVSERLIGLTIVAIGTSLPELVISLSATIKKNTGLAVGNIVGSNIFNIIFIVGATALITPIPFDSKFILDAIITLCATVMLFIFSLLNSKLNWITGIIMILSYALYFAFVLL